MRLRANILTRAIARRLAKRVPPNRPPDFIIGDLAEPYMLRWWVIPRNKVFNIYLHRFMRDDEDRALHDHPWPSLSIALSGGMIEVYRNQQGDDAVRNVGAGDIVFRGAKFAHRMIVPEPSWTIFITGPVIREWGFLCPEGWRHWKEFTASRDGKPGQIGRGCE